MKIFKDTFTKKIEYDKYFKGQEVCFLDIETTGFSREYNFIYLIGIVYYNPYKNMWESRQIFADNRESEKDVLLKLIEYIENFDLIVTYNGDSFDIPFINSRFQLYDIDFNLFSIENFDIYKFIKENNVYLDFKNYKLKTVERNLGIFRDDIYSGGDCIRFYKGYLKTRNKELLERILQHNYDDLFYLIDIIRIIDTIEEKKTIEIPNGKIIIDNMIVVGDVFKVEGNIFSSETIKLLYYEDLYTIDINKGRFMIKFSYNIGLVTPEKKGLFIDKNKFALSNIPTLNANFEVPHRFMLLQVGKKIFVENIKSITSNLIDSSLKKLM